MNGGKRSGEIHVQIEKRGGGGGGLGQSPSCQSWLSAEAVAVKDGSKEGECVKGCCISAQRIHSLASVLHVLKEKELPSDHLGKTK